MFNEKQRKRTQRTLRIFVVTVKTKSIQSNDSIRILVDGLIQRRKVLTLDIRVREILYMENDIAIEFFSHREFYL